jgi:hypothetical protein
MSRSKSKWIVEERIVERSSCFVRSPDRANGYLRLHSIVNVFAVNWRQVHEFTPHLLDRKRQVINHCQVVTNTPCNFSQKKLDLLFNNKVSIFVAIWMWINKISTLNAFSFLREYQFFIELFANSLLLLLSLTKSWSTFYPNMFSHSHMLLMSFHFVASDSFLCFRVLWNIITFQSPNLILIVWLCLTFVINLKDYLW